MEQQYKPSHEPIFWGLFGFGGTVIAFAMPIILICMIIAGFTNGTQNFNILEAISHWWGAGALFLIILGIAFHSAHRIYFSLCDLKCHTGIPGQIILYGIALMMTLTAGGALGMYYLNL